MNDLLTGSFDDKKIASELKGNMLRAYLALLGSENVVMGVRELQRKFGFSSPALAAYHLKKLEELGLITEERGDYSVLREVKVGVLEQFIKLGTLILPRYIFYATLFTTLLIFFVSQLKKLDFYNILD